MTDTAFNPSYIGDRPDIVSLIPPNAKVVLDVGCSTGAVGAAIKVKTGAQVIGIEVSAEMAREARNRIDKVFVGDAQTIMLERKMDTLRFDTIIFGDLLEHLVDPWAVLKAATGYLDSEGTIIASIPNVRHMNTIYNLVLRGHWPYRERGIHDRTHLRFFTKKDIYDLFASAGLTIDVVKTHYRIIERPHRLNSIARFFAIPVVRNFLAFQYVMRAHLAHSN